MNESDAPRGYSGSDTAVAELQSSVRQLYGLLNLSVLVLIVLSFSLFVFMLREIKVVSRQLDEQSRFVAEYHQTIEPRIDQFRAKLETFALAHPDFNPVFVKYFGVSNAPLSRVRPATSALGGGGAPVRP
jgi:hypothetical protein